MRKKSATKKIKKTKYDLIYGAHSVIELLRAKKRKLYSIYTTRPVPKSFSRIERYLPKYFFNTSYVSKDVLTRMAGTNDHMGIVALVSEFKFCKNIFDPKKNPFILLLDSIQDVRNLGAILRSAYCTGVDGVVLCKKGAAPLNAVAHKTSTGLVERLNVYLAPSIKSAVMELKNAGYKFYMSVIKNGKDATNVDYEVPLCLVIGSEAIGISKSLLKEGKLITLPQKTDDVSYNASVAAGILLFLLSEKIERF
ncbi:RNA methyltransferase [Candidatus Babeliales bacterium]|nr:RNA methyltransferase [Candidatus Babeliales bacterium]